MATAANSGTPVALPGEDDDDEEDITRIIVGKDAEMAEPDEPGYPEFLQSLVDAIASKSRLTTKALLTSYPEFADQFRGSASPKALAAIETIVGKPKAEAGAAAE